MKPQILLTSTGSGVARACRYETSAPSVHIVSFFETPQQVKITGRDDIQELKKACEFALASYAPTEQHAH